VVSAPKTAKNRLHMDLNVAGEGTPEEQWQRIAGEVERLQALGASILMEYAGHHVTMADPEGNEFDLC
jgi:Glyoxalase-like domain